MPDTLALSMEGSAIPFTIVDLGLEILCLVVARLTCSFKIDLKVKSVVGVEAINGWLMWLIVGLVSERDFSFLSPSLAGKEVVQYLLRYPLPPHPQQVIDLCLVALYLFLVDTPINTFL